MFSVESLELREHLLIKYYEIAEIGKLLNGLIQSRKKSLITYLLSPITYFFTYLLTPIAYLFTYLLSPIICAQQPTIVITEILAYEEPQLQFIELYNQTTYQIDLNRYKLTISTSPDFRGKYTHLDIIISWPENIKSPHTNVIISTTTINPNQYALIISTSYADSNKIHGIPPNTLILTTTDYILSKKGLRSTDRIRLSPPVGVVISTFGSTFTPFTSWRVSIERKGKIRDNKEIYYNDDISDNWLTSRSLTGSTPGTKNTVVPADVSKIEKIEKIINVSNSPFYPHGDHIRQTVSISYNIPANTTVTLKIFDINGSLILTPINQESTLAGLNNHQAGFYCIEENDRWKGTYHWNGRNEKGDIVPIGVYIAYIEAVEPDKGRIHKGKAGIVIGRKLR